MHLSSSWYHLPHVKWRDGGAWFNTAWHGKLLRCPTSYVKVAALQQGALARGPLSR